jgi:uncharacterized phage protein (TIGR02218 family)
VSKNIINAQLAAGEHFAFCFQFNLKNGDVLHLTSCDIKIMTENNYYEPYSGLKIDLCTFNDSAHDEVKISGVFEPRGISKNLKLDESTVRISYYFFRTKLYAEWLTYMFDKIQYDGMNFELFIKSEAVKLQQSILKNFSTTCRTNFGDAKCKVEITFYSGMYNVVHIEKNVINISECTRPDGFFDGGKIIFYSGITYDIKTHTKHALILKSPCDEKVPQRVTLTPGCDKKFITCCNKYNNAVNFRGEPAIPWKTP